MKKQLLLFSKCSQQEWHGAWGRPAIPHLRWWLATLPSPCHAGPLQFQRSCRKRRCCEWGRHPGDPRGAGRAPPSAAAASCRRGGTESTPCARAPCPPCGSWTAARAVKKLWGMENNHFREKDNTDIFPQVQLCTLSILSRPFPMAESNCMLGSCEHLKDFSLARGWDGCPQIIICHSLTLSME